MIIISDNYNKEYRLTVNSETSNFSLSVQI
jgi:hypothetical protein